MTLLHRITRKIGYLIAAVIILAALLVSITRLLTPVLNDHRADFEKLASDLLQMPVMIREVKVDWHGYSPEIVLHSVTLLDPDTQKPKINLERLEIDFSIWRTLLDRKVFVRNITLSGMELTITQMSAEEFQIGSLTSLNIKDTLTGSSVKTDEVFAWVFSQPRLALEDINIIYAAPDEDPRSITLKFLSLRNTGQHHIIDGEATLNQDLPINVNVALSWDGDPKHLEQAKGQLYVYLEGLSLKQWFSKMSWDGIQIRKGLASVKIWGNWSNNQWQKIQTTFQAYNLEFYSEVQQHVEAIDRLRGQLGWKRDGDAEVFSGKEIYIDFPYHLWPATNFSVKLVNNAAGDLVFDSGQINYVNLADTMKLLTLSNTFLGDSIREELLALSPRGEIQNLKIAAGDPVTDLQHLTLSGTFSGLTLNSYKHFPGVSNFKGSVNWNKTEGEFKIDSTHVFITANQFFGKPLYFDQIQADVQLQKNIAGMFVAKAKNIIVNNPDLSASTSFNIAGLQDDNPDIDFSAQFSINNIAHIADYLPAKIFDQELSQWLQNAFKKGKAFQGNAEVQGKLKDFPFDNHDGKFLITMQLKDMTLNFAPGWPTISNILGDLTFAGRTMQVNIQSGAIGGVPVKKITANIPYIGDAAPQILQVDGVIQSDLSQGLSFIHQSPLQKTIGSDLAGMNLTGAMELNLGLNVPLKHPENTIVNGDVVMTDGGLSLPQWKIHFNKLNGSFQFTEKGIEAKNIQGQLFGAPATLVITTLDNDKKATGQVKADITSLISIPVLESWTGMTLSALAQGSANYQATLLFAHNKGVGNQLELRSNLQGIAINLPAPFAKKASDAGVFQLTLLMGEADVLKAKINYAKQISAALVLKTAGQKMQLTSAEIKFGGGSADWQSAPGILISGTMKQLDWDTWPDYFASLKNKNHAAPAKAAKPYLNSDLKLLRAINLNIGTLSLMGQDLHQVNLQLTNNVNKWTVNLGSQEISGQIIVPDNLATQPLQANFQHVYLTAANAAKMKQKIDPRTLPAMSIESDSTHLGDMKIGHLTLNLEPSHAGLLIKKLNINEPLLNFNATGEWLSNNGRYSSHLEGMMTSPKVSDVLTEWGFNSSNFIGSTGEVKFNLSWPDAPYQLTLNGLSGNVSFDFGKGVIVELSDSSNAKIGLSRMLNLFSLSSIPRRLSLDFSDVTQKGFSFDYMKGDFVVKNGSAITDDMRFDGPIARVEIKGRVGLAAKDFNMQLSVTPYVTGSLPVVAAFAGGPIVGVAALLVDKVVSQSVSKVITYHYNVTGPWTNPVWTKVGGTPQPVNTATPQPQSNGRNATR